MKVTNCLLLLHKSHSHKLVASFIFFHVLFFVLAELTQMGTLSNNVLKLSV
jgi:hypothetical protein